MATVELNLQSFETAIKDNAMVIIDFWAPWCGPCKSFAPVYEKISEKYPDIVFAKVNTEEEQSLAQHFGIRSIPTLMVFRDEIMIFQQPGALSEAAFDEVVTKAKDLDMDMVRAEIAKQQAEGQA